MLGPSLPFEDTLDGGYIILEGGLRLLNDADVVAILDKVVVNAPLAGTVRPGTVDEGDIFYGGFLSLQVRCAPLDSSVENTLNRLTILISDLFLVKFLSAFRGPSIVKKFASGECTFCFHCTVRLLGSDT
jgi:hypothetical protein